MKFEERYKEQTQKLHADKNDLQEIIKKYRQQENVVDFSEVSAMNKNRNKILRRITAAAAALALVAVSAAIAFKSGGFIKPASISSYPSEQVNTISAGDRDIDSLIKTSQVNVSDSYEELFAKIYELQSVNRYAKAAGAILDEPVEYGADGFAAEDSAMVDLLAAGSDSQTSTAASTAAAPADPNYVTDTVALKKEAAPANGETDDYSETNAQVKGVDEGDIVKTDGKFIYTLTGETLRITSADSGKLKVLSRLNFDSESYGYPSEMYIAPDRVAIISTSYGFVYAAGDEEAAGDDSRQRTFITVYDTTDKENPSLIGTLAQNGTFVSSRMVDGYIYIVSNYDIYAQIERNKPETYVPCLYEKGAERTVAADKIALYDTVQNSSYTVVTSVSIENPDAHAGEAAVLGGNSNIYCDGKSLVTADTSYIYEEGEIKPDASGKNRKVDVSTQKTVLTRFELNNGAIEKKASSTIPGALLNQFSMDIYNNVLRIVATNFMSKTTTYTDGVDTYEYEDKQSNSVYTLDENLNMLGKIENIAENESVQSVRFDGNVGYFVTFRQVDPLFAVDLSNPSNPRIMSALKIPGFSQYLHKFDEGLLFGIGYDADEETGWTNKMKMTMFDISDPFDVTEKHTLKLDIDSSEASYNHKAILIDRERNLIAFPAQKWDEKEGKASYLIYGYDENTGFFEKKEVNLDDEWLYNSRGLFIGDFFYVTSDNGIVSFDMTEFGKIDSVKWQSMSPEK